MIDNKNVLFLRTKNIEKFYQEEGYKVVGNVITTEISVL